MTSASSAPERPGVQGGAVHDGLAGDLAGRDRAARVQGGEGEQGAAARAYGADGERHHDGDQQRQRERDGHPAAERHEGARQALLEQDGRPQAGRADESGEQAREEPREQAGPLM
ncbi:hypothetical protein ACFQQB_00305 [Nonomuraea rubra]|uniref:hypothetical protein n=1 Tax=Nonomuraea rubra TaxID=46180 RepID=UPI003611B8BA